MGHRLGPLVGYAFTYEPGKQFVGDIYANFSKAEMHPRVLKFFATALSLRVYETLNVDPEVYCGAPLGGYSLSDALGFINPDAMVIKAEKKVTAMATETSREKSKLVFGRHEIMPGQKVVIVEDVCNNFSTTEELVRLISAAGGEVLAIACFLNRSLTFDLSFALTIASVTVSIPVISLVRKPFNEWKQDDLAVAKDVAESNVVWSPKGKNGEWARLMKAMNDYTP